MSTIPLVSHRIYLPPHVLIPALEYRSSQEQMRDAYEREKHVASYHPCSPYRTSRYSSKHIIAIASFPVGSRCLQGRPEIALRSWKNLHESCSAIPSWVRLSLLASLPPHLIFSALLLYRSLSLPPSPSFLPTHSSLPRHSFTAFLPPSACGCNPLAGPVPPRSHFSPCSQRSSYPFSCSCTLAAFLPLLPALSCPSCSF